jgi:hypothetical protein
LGRERDMGLSPSVSRLGSADQQNREDLCLGEKPDFIVVVHDDEIIVRTLGFLRDLLQDH